MTNLSPLSGEERNSDFGAVRSVDDPSRTFGRRSQSEADQCDCPASSARIILRYKTLQSFSRQV
jgi:hypothetical protein